MRTSMWKGDASSTRIFLNFSSYFFMINYLLVFSSFLIASEHLLFKSSDPYLLDSAHYLFQHSLIPYLFSFLLCMGSRSRVFTYGLYISLLAFGPFFIYVPSTIYGTVVAKLVSLQILIYVDGGPGKLPIFGVRKFDYLRPQNHQTSVHNFDYLRLALVNLCPKI